ncbi:aminotransferase class V [Haladaptatus paucihalophilus DX253]|uniref:Aminotransferase class V n=1 Tax=Haladaptatus paucihalophilus DX253 TaxID=797209 RepID=E7QTA5_HALPU|nr:aminotransferase class V-fold PLP-dependent enzyme [Haladaptatus paucihalophilus]EFW91834.1 aminotransferase class V [Haladaptatus paucihalophilus DX253]SHK80654.1 Selenocysteine lyase/Cysteine desulfurase [Haladaptatus paucihalophilus DX253]
MEPTALRADIPALERTTYMNTGASGPSPTRVVEANESCLERHEYETPADEGMYPFTFDVLDRTRKTVADHLGATAEEIALTQSTTDGINRIAAALDWESGDRVVRTDLEHSSGILPWKRLERQGVETDVLSSEDGRLDLDAVKDAVTDAKLVCFSALTWTHGTMLPVRELTDIARDAGALVLVDAVQCPGQMALDVTEWDADFVAGAGHKWLLGPFGAGFVSVRSGAERHLNPAHIGYRSVEDANAEAYTYEPGAHRLEVGTVSPAPYAGLGEAIDVIEEVGYDTIESRIRELTDRLKEGLVASDDARLLSPREYESGLVTFEVDDPDAFVERLAGEGIRIRSLPYPNNSVRASVHVFNTADDIDALLEHV